ncbi:MAG: PAS domain-containing protein [Verrucomicrobiota bacterium]
MKSSRGTGLNAKLAQENAKLAQENARLAQERDLLRTLFDSLPDNLFIKDRQSRFLTSNLAHVRTLGATRPDEVTGKTDLDIFPAELANQYYGDEQALMESGQPLNREETVVNPRTGEKRWLQTTKIPLRDKNGKVVGVMGINRDITDRKQMEEALRQSRDELEQRVIKRTAELSAKNAELAQTNEARASAHRLLQAMLDNVPDRIYFKDTESRFIQCNRAVAKRVGVEEPKQVIGKTDFDFYPREKAEEFRKDDQKLIQSGEALLNKTEQVIKPNGEITWSSVTKVPLRDENGKAVGLVGISRDITERKQAEEALARERLLLRTLIDNLPDGIYAKDTACRKTLVNPADLKNLCCKSEAEALGKSDFDFYPRDLAEKFYADDQNVLQGQPVINREEYVLDEKGEKRWLMTSKLPLRDQNGKIVGLVGVGRDITHRKQAEEALRQSEERLREVMQHTHCILHSGQVEGLEGWRERALDPVSPFHWDLPVQNEETAQEIFPLELAPGEQYQQGWYRTWNRADHIQMNRNSGNALLNDLPFYRNEFRCTDKHEVEHWMQQFVTIHKLAENRWQLFCITTDITDLKATESALRSSEEKLRQFTVQLERSNRELQDFAYVASHDLQEPLRKIVVFGERLREKNSEALGPEALDYLERMQKAAGRMQTLINDLLTFSRVTTKAHPFAPANLAEIASEVVNDLEGRIELVKGRVELGTLPVIDAEALQMRQLLQNLIGNALKFRRPEEPPVVKVEAQIIPDPITPAKKLCRLTVSDNCIGFDEKYLDRIFNVFQRLHTRNEYEGTGMGLAIVRKIALYHGGDITAKSKLGQGSTFILTLPVVHPKKAQDENKETTMNKETTTNNK